jgi:hypothetical protein
MTAGPLTIAAELARLPRADPDGACGLAYSSAELTRRSRDLKPSELALLLDLECRAHRSSIPSWAGERVGLITNIKSTKSLAAEIGIHRNTFTRRFEALRTLGYCLWFHRATRTSPGAILCLSMRTEGVRLWPF